MEKIKVQETEITVVQVNNEDYLCLTDMLKAKDGDFFITDWLRKRNTLEYIGIWEKVYNPNFNYGEFATIKSQSGLNSFKISVKEFVARTNATSLQAKAGRYGGTYAHKDIAFEFAMWISPEFKIYIVKEFQRLKSDEQKLLGWSAKRELAKINYRIHTDTIKQNLIPPELSAQQKSFVYADEADLLNVAMFGLTAKEWRESNPDLKGNIRDYATINQLICLSNMENLKLGSFKAQKGQMDLYLNYLEKNMMAQGEESPIGLIIISRAKNEEELKITHRELLSIGEGK